jgi:hypothetical protein
MPSTWITRSTGEPNPPRTGGAAPQGRASLFLSGAVPTAARPHPARSPWPDGQGYASPGLASKRMAARMGKPIRAAIGRLFGAETAQADA